MQFFNRPKKEVGIVEMLHSVSIRKQDNECGQLVTNESSCDVFEKALHMTQTREQRESACFEKGLWWCSLAFLINFLLTRLPHCISHLPKAVSQENLWEIYSTLHKPFTWNRILSEDTASCETLHSSALLLSPWSRMIEATNQNVRQRRALST